MHEKTTERAGLTFTEALIAIRERAARSHGEWVGAESDRASLTLAWSVDPPDLACPEALRVTRRFVPPVSEDLERAAEALPADVEIGPIRADDASRSLTLGLRPRTRRTEAERCARCGASPRFGTRLYGDAQRCAVCSLYVARSEPDQRGSALIGAILVTLLLAMLVGGAMLHLEAAERKRGAASALGQLDVAAEGILDLMTDRLRSRAAARLGGLDPSDLTALDAAVPSLPAPTGAALDVAGTGYRVVAVRELDPIPDDAELLDVWADQPRVRYAALPRPQGQTASRTIEVEMRVRVTGPAGTARTLTRTAAVSRLPAYPFAVYWNGGTAEFCSTTEGVTIVGPVRVDGLAHFQDCAGPVRLAGTLDARDGIRNDAPRNRVSTGNGSLPIDTWTRATAETSATLLLGSSQGHLRIPPAAGGTYEAGRAQDANRAGTGECADRTLACGGNGYFAPGVTLQRTVVGASRAFSITCGEAYAYGTGCTGGVMAAVRYEPWPWTSVAAAGLARTDPADPRRLWRGLLFDPRREARCTATVGGHTFPTHRCPSNVFGWLLDLSALPPVAGGVLHVRAASIDPVGRAAAGAQEALVIRAAEQLAAPLTIIADVPVFIVGSLNTARAPAWRGPPPLMLDAPRITLVPAEADVALGLAPGTAGWTSIWDLVPPAGSSTASALPVTAATSATLYAVLRTRVCGRPQGVYQGGVLDQAPAILGDWSAVEVRVVGAVELAEDGGLSAAACRWWGGGHGAAEDGSRWSGPASRTILHDPRLAHPAFVVPGSFLPANVPASGVAGAARRNRARQATATGGYGVLRLTQGTGRRPRAAVPLAPPPAIPPAPPALPK